MINRGADALNHSQSGFDVQLPLMRHKGESLPRQIRISMFQEFPIRRQTNRAVCRDHSLSGLLRVIRRRQARESCSWSSH